MSTSFPGCLFFRFILLLQGKGRRVAPGNKVEGKGISKLTAVFKEQYLISGWCDHPFNEIESKLFPIDC